jgi:hypothetical protein
MHRVDVSNLLTELNDAARRPQVPQPPDAEPESPLYRRFIVAALVCTLTLGASFGAYNLACIHLAFGPVPPPHNWTHAGFQIFGFVLAFIMGVAYHVLPRFLSTTLILPRVAQASFWLLFAGLLLRTYGQFGGLLPATHALYVLGAVGLLASVLAFAISLGLTYWRARPPFECYHAFLATGTLCWVLAAQQAFAPPADYERLYQLALFGGALFWIQGMLLRIGPGFLGLQPPRSRTIWVALALGVGGIGLALASLAAAPLLFALDVVVFAAGARLLEARVHRHDPAFARTIDLATAFSLLFALLAGAWSALTISGRPPPSLLWDGARHAFALGFVTLTIFGVASRVLPIFGGAELAWPRLRDAGVAFIAVAVVGREMEVVATVARWPGLLVVSGGSGLVAAFGVALCSLSLFGTLRRGRAVALGRAEPVAVGPDVTVAALVASHPESLAVLIEAGFSPLANPVLRRTLGRTVTLRTACQLHGVELDPLLARVRSACAVPPAACREPNTADLVPVARLTRSQGGGTRRAHSG